MQDDPLSQQKSVIEWLKTGEGFDHPVGEVQLIETHISWVLLTGQYAYKIKKALNLGFLDYSSLAKRKHQCEEELRLNRRTAPGIYLQVVAIGGPPEQPRLHGSPAIEYMVKMRQFPQQALLTQMLARGALTDAHIESLAETIADFHASIAVAAAASRYGTVEIITHPIDENFTQLRARISSAELLTRLQTIEQRNHSFLRQERALFERRKREGFIRDCHGDLHLNNILLLDDQPLLFDCIEFNSALRIIDVISELAFLVMDLQQHQRGEQANLLLNSYLERSGDYEGIRLLNFYLCYRAMVRAKVVTIRLGQSGLAAEEERDIHHDFDAYLRLAEGYTEPGHPHIYITHGLSGSGKTTLTTSLMQHFAAIRIRSDIERKRLFGLQGSEHSANANIYTADASNMTYQHLADLAVTITRSGYPVIIDATFLEQYERDRFRKLAAELGAPFTILHFHTRPEELTRRVQKRVEMGKDASEADIKVLAGQINRYRPLGEDEMAETVVIDTEADHPLAAIRAE
jgi:aminoglycoside phosphotransferase family enzyme/predicted kinase